MKIAFAYSTKDRPEFTRQTLPPVLAESEKMKFDLYWMDGSDSDEAVGLVDSYQADTRISGIRYNVRGGAAASIIFSLSYLLSHRNDYDYIGLIENDILLSPDWFDTMFHLFDQPDVNVGSVSARCFSDRILVPRDGHAVVSNTGAGMVLFKRECVEWILREWHTPYFHQLQQFFKQATEIGYPIPWMLQQSDPQLTKQYIMTHDWGFEVSLLLRGMVSLAPTPSMAKNIDNVTDKFQTSATKSVSTFDWKRFCNKINSLGKST